MISAIMIYWKWVAMAALVAAVGVQQVRVSNAKADTAAAQQELADDRTRYAQLAQAAEQSARLEEQRREDAARKVISEAQAQTNIARDDAVRALSAAERLRKRTVQLSTASCRSANPATPSGSKAADEATDLLAYVRRRLDEAEAGTIGFADSASIAGEACVAIYDALTVKP